MKYTCQNGKVRIILPANLKQEALAFSFTIKK